MQLRILLRNFDQKIFHEIFHFFKFIEIIVQFILHYFYLFYYFFSISTYLFIYAYGIQILIITIRTLLHLPFLPVVSNLYFYINNECYLIKGRIKTNQNLLLIIFEECYNWVIIHN